jgi:hypothetical protein
MFHFVKILLFLRFLQRFLRNKQGVERQTRVVDTRAHRHGHPNSIRDNEHRKLKKNGTFERSPTLKKSHFFLIFPSPYLSIYSRYIPDTFPTHTRYIRISYEYSPNIPRISHEYPKAPPKMLEISPIATQSLKCIFRIILSFFCKKFW